MWALYKAEHFLPKKVLCTTPPKFQPLAKCMISFRECRTLILRARSGFRSVSKKKALPGNVLCVECYTLLNKNKYSIHSHIQTRSSFQGPWSRGEGIQDIRKCMSICKDRNKLIALP